MCAHRVSEVPPATPIERSTVWLGGGSTPDLALRGERGSFAIAGLLAVATGVAGAVFAGFALAGATALPLVAIVPLALAIGIVATLLIRLTATITRTPGQAIAHIAVAVVVGLATAELASLTFFHDAIDDELKAKAATSARAEISDLTTERDRLTTDIASATAESERTLEIANCEKFPNPECPANLVTGIPGVAAEALNAEAAHAKAQAEQDRLVAARAEVDDQISAARADLSSAQSQTPTAGLGNRWTALNSYSFASTGALFLRLGTVAVFVLLALLPFLMRRWRGETSFDRAQSVREIRDQADREAEAEIARQRAAARVERERIWREQHLESESMAATAQLDRERAGYHREFATTFGELENGRSAPALGVGASEAYMTEQREPGSEIQPLNSGNLSPSTELAPRSGFAGAAARFVRPLVPDFVARAVEVGTNPMRAVKQVFEETEEISFSLKRTRKVTVEAPAPAVDTRVVYDDPTYAPQVNYQDPFTTLPAAPVMDIGRELTGQGVYGELPEANERPQT